MPTEEIQNRNYLLAQARISYQDLRTSFENDVTLKNM